MISPRLSLRLAMILVAVVALAIAGTREATRRYREAVAFHEQKLIHHRTNAAMLRFSPDPPAWLPSPLPPPSPAELDATRRAAEYHEAMALKYERAARYPWLPVEPDPPEPGTSQ